MQKLGLVLSFLLVSSWTTLCFAADPKDPANPNASPQAKAVLKYFQNLDASSEKHLISGQFDNYGDRAGVPLMDQIHDKTGHYPALLGVDYAGRGAWWSVRRIKRPSIIGGMAGW